MNRQGKVSGDLEPEVMEQVDLYCGANGITRAAFLRMAVDHFLFGEASDPWALGYVEGVRSGHADLRGAMAGLLAQLQGAADAARQYAAQVRADATARRGVA